LHPAELGAVHVRALLHDGVLTVTIACADESARHAVTAALPSLHSQLSDLKSLDVQLSGGHSDDRSAGNAQAQNQAQSQQNGNSDRRQEAAAGLSGTADSTGAISSTNSTTSVRRTGGRNDGLDRWM
jgi:flagellar hook-length control protein FliK